MTAPPAQPSSDASLSDTTMTIKPQKLKPDKPAKRTRKATPKIIITNNSAGKMNPSNSTTTKRGPTTNVLNQGGATDSINSASVDGEAGLSACGDASAVFWAQQQNHHIAHSGYGGMASIQHHSTHNAPVACPYSEYETL